MIDWHGHVEILEAAGTIGGGGVIAYPTEAVWGLGCDPFSEQAVKKILWLKQRPVDKGLILIGSGVEHFSQYLLGLEPKYLQLFAIPLSQPTTWLVPDNGFAPRWVVGNHATVALRITLHPVVSALCNTFGGAIVSTSANPQGLPAATTQIKVEEYFAGSLDFYAPGDVVGASRESEIKNLLTGEVIRSG
jgi:L-threonylcarbamoyladenylate synthase